MNTLFEGIIAVTMDEAQPVIKNACVAVTGDTITYVGSDRPEGQFDRIVDGTGYVLMPGLVNAHTHLTMSLMRGYGGGHDLQTWLNDYIFPVEAKLDSRAVRAGTALGLAEAIATGTTCVADMYNFCDDIAQMVCQSGISANLSRGIVLFDVLENPTTIDGWKETVALKEQWDGYGDGQIKVDVSIHGEYTSFMSPKLWDVAGQWATEHDLGMHVHLSETQSEHSESIARHGKTPTQIFDDHGLWSPRSIAAHAVYVDEQDMAILAERNVSVIHNPVSNLKLGSGVAPVPQMMQAGINVAMGTDGVASNNTHDMFEEIKLTAILHKGVTRNPTAISAREVLRMATINGAEALGRNTGMIQAGKIADLIMLDFTKPHLIPCHDVEENLVFSARGSDVAMTMARGKIIYEHGALLTLDLSQIQSEIEDYALPLLFDKK